MLSKTYLDSALVGAVAGITAADQILEANGLDAILELVTTLRSVSFPAVILEARSSGSIQLVEGPLDTYTESIWVMGQLGRGESEAQIYRDTMALMRLVLAKLLNDAKSGLHPELDGWDWTRTTYMKRYGGQNARGWELVLTFKENFSLLFPQTAGQ